MLICRECLKDEDGLLQELFAADIEFTTSCLKYQPKSYWVWHHRKWCLQNMPHPSWERELAILEKMLNLDARNCEKILFIVSTLNNCSISPPQLYYFALRAYKFMAGITGNMCSKTLNQELSRSNWSLQPQRSMKTFPTFLHGITEVKFLLKHSRMMKQL
jgi:Protein prenyltransferase alpha subunit repeat